MTLTALFLIYSQVYQLPPGLLESTCYIESKHNTQAIHRDDGKGNSVGVCQVKLKTAKSLGFHGTENQLIDPATNIRFAAQYLKYQIKRYRGDINKALTAYNKGNSKGLTSSKYSATVIKVWKKEKK